MTLSVHDLGDTPILRADFSTLDEQPATPTDLSGWVRSPDGVVVALEEFESLETGVWVSTVTVDQPGRWFWRIEFTGATLPQAEEHTFLVREQYVNPEGS